jgi:hypothetical protein
MAGINGGNAMPVMNVEKNDREGRGDHDRDVRRPLLIISRSVVASKSLQGELGPFGMLEHLVKQLEDRIAHCVKVSRSADQAEKPRPKSESAKQHQLEDFSS